MDSSDFNNRPVTPRTAVDQPPTHQHIASQTQPVHKPKASSIPRPKKSYLKPIIILLAVALIVFISVFGSEYIYFRENKGAVGTTTVNSSEYQAVFLTNGQVYFGKIQSVNQYYISMTNIFYLQVQQSVQPASTEGTSTTSSTSSSAATSTSASDSNSNGSVQLVKLGNELHGPEDQMTILRPQILFWENLKPSGKVTQAINQYYESNK